MKQHKKLSMSIAVILFLIILGATVVYIDKTTPSQTRVIPEPTSADITITQQSALRTEVIAENLSVPWDLTFLPDGDLLFTERNGKLKRLYLTSDQHVQDIFTIPDVLQTGESGLHGIALHPDFSENKFVYLYYTYANNGGNTRNRVVRYKYSDSTLKDRTFIVDNIPGALFHDGGRIRFGPDKYLYITTGDAQEPSLAQDRNSLAGKILRVTDTGDPAPGNPFGNRTYSYGHRNPQGITWDDQGYLWETEHGPSGTGSECCRDELNLIKSGQNYGWPEITGLQDQSGMISPVLQSGNSTWAPASVIYHNGSLYFGGLRGQALYESVINPDNSIKELISNFQGEFGRIRGVIKGPDGLIYISTSNRDGRGIPNTGDDKIIRINPDVLR